MSGGCGAAACQAFTQRAMIKRLQGDDEGCRADFKLAADLGSPFAKKQLVELNPYAALCNSMLAQMMKKTCQGKPTDSIDTLG
ncbi:TTC36 [Bugula neritina]|uniref:TTC36 n=1 Tax=Bugula neritina TaxID=10212 RepID=A0A7J7JEQ2_BUGNE|nr:TTC36 [Bugula neritina]